MLDHSLPPRARILYYLLDDRANDDRELWWHWSKLAALSGFGRSQFFEAVTVLKQAGVLNIRTEGTRTIYFLPVRKTGIRPETESGKPEWPVRKTGMNADLSLVNLFNETVPLNPPAGDRLRQIIIEANGGVAGFDEKLLDLSWYALCPACDGEKTTGRSEKRRKACPHCQARGFIFAERRSA
jgi:hypothetical protein